MPEKQQVFSVFFVFWVALGLSSFLFFQFCKDVKLKQKILPFFIIGPGVIFAVFAAWMSNWQPVVLMVSLPFVALITFLNLRTMKICPKCGRMLYRQPIFAKTRFCSYCGSNLERTNTSD